MNRAFGGLLGSKSGGAEAQTLPPLEYAERLMSYLDQKVLLAP